LGSAIASASRPAPSPPRPSTTSGCATASRCQARPARSTSRRPTTATNRLSVRVTATFPSREVTCLSSKTSPVREALVATARPVLSGRPRIGETLSVAGDSWEKTPEVVRHEWYHDGRLFSTNELVAVRRDRGVGREDGPGSRDRDASRVRRGHRLHRRGDHPAPTTLGGQPDGRGFVHDVRLEALPWGFSLDAIAPPVDVWHGRDDTIVRCEQAQIMADAIPGVQRRFVAGEGHFSLVMLRSASYLGPFR
jgi:pimeloyl-ACP methyl ester carboxylesterase